MNRVFEQILKERLSEKEPFIQVLLGPRQVGKTTAMLRVLETVRGRKFFTSADDTLSASPLWLQEQWQLAESAGSGTLLVIDEVQRVSDWAKVIKGLWDRSLRNKKRIKVVLLGSSSLSIQTGLTESLAGRFELITVPHWGFHESRKEFGYSIDDWLRWGGYPGSDSFRKNDARWRSYLTQSIVDAVIGRDILTLKTVKNPALFRQAFAIACGFPAQELSYAKLLGQLQDAGNTDLVKSYLELYEGAFLLFSIFKYSKNIRAVKSSSPKLILGCPALAHLALGSEYVCSPEGRGRVFESAVGMELLHIPDGKVYWWREGDNEIDFVVRIEQTIYAIEVKSGRRKRTGGMESFLKVEPSAIPCFVTKENFEKFAKSPRGFLVALK
jgi:predicted AAA+ superfamily ATPase